eukprot:jgi/Chrzof1/2062/Cz11g01150.t1
MQEHSCTRRSLYAACYFPGLAATYPACCCPMPIMVVPYHPAITLWLLAAAAANSHQDTTVLLLHCDDCWAAARCSCHRGQPSRIRDFLHHAW